MYKSHRLLLILCLAYGFSSAYAQSQANVQLTLPESEEWIQVTDFSNEHDFVKEWIPEGTSLDSTHWLITYQKLTLSKKTSAKKYINTIFKSARSSCTSVLFNGPSKIKLRKLSTYVGKIMCAEQIGKNYGVFNDIRIIVDGKTAYVVTSELRLPASSVAGVFSFDDRTKIEPFMQSVSASSSFVRDGIGICYGNEGICTPDISEQ